MLKKLLKYDMRAVWRLGWISAVIVPIAAIIAAFSTRFLSTPFDDTDFLGAIAIIFAALLLFASVIAVILSFVLTMILVLARFYKNFFTDEGYLTFTLPTTRSKMLFSKTLNAFIWFTAHILLIIASFAVYLLLAPRPDSDEILISPFIYEQLAELFSLIFKGIGVWIIVILALLFICMLVMLLMSITMLQLSITIGSVIAKKAKIIVSIGIYYAINTALTMFWQLVYTSFSLTVFSSAADTVSISSTGEMGAVVSLVLLIFIAINAVIASLLYCFTQNLLDRRLNLA